MAKTLKVRSTLKGKDVLFRGYDGNDYLARIVRVKNGVAELNYNVPGVIGVVTAYVSDAARLFSAD